MLMGTLLMRAARLLGRTAAQPLHDLHAGEKDTAKEKRLKRFPRYAQPSLVSRR